MSVTLSVLAITIHCHAFNSCKCIWESMGKPCSCTQYIKSRIFTASHTKICIRYCRSRWNLYQYYQVTWNPYQYYKSCETRISTTSHVKRVSVLYKSCETRICTTNHVKPVSVLPSHVKPVSILQVMWKPISVLQVQPIAVPDKISLVCYCWHLPLLHTHNNTDSKKIVIFPV